MTASEFTANDVYRIHMLALEEFEKVCDRKSWCLRVSPEKGPEILFRKGTDESVIESARRRWRLATVGMRYGSVPISIRS